MNKRYIDILQVTHLQGPSMWTYPPVLEALIECLPLFDMVTALDDHGSNALGQAENLIRNTIAKATGALE